MLWKQVPAPNFNSVHRRFQIRRSYPSSEHSSKCRHRHGRRRSAEKRQQTMHANAQYGASPQPSTTPRRDNLYIVHVPTKPNGDILLPRLRFAKYDYARGAFCINLFAVVSRAFNACRLEGYLMKTRPYTTRVCIPLLTRRSGDHQ